MATTTTRLDLRKPSTTDVVNVTTDISNNMDIIDSQMGMEIVSSFPADAYAGKMVMRSDEGNAVYVYSGAAWLRIMVEEQQPSVMQPVEDWDPGGIAEFTNGTYQPYTPTVSATFVCPPSGRVYVTATAALEASAGATAWVSWEIRENNASGAIRHAATDSVKGVAQQDLFNHQGSTRTTAPLTAGETFYCRLMHRIQGGGSSWGQIFYAGILVEPVID